MVSPLLNKAKSNPTRIGPRQSKYNCFSRCIRHVDLHGVIQLHQQEIQVSLKKTATRGAKWTALSSVVVTAAMFLQLTVLSRLLIPSDFGLMATVLVVIGIAQIFADMGISAAIIHFQETDEDQLSSLYWLNIFSGMSVFAIVVCSAPLVAYIYSEPRLIPIILSLSVTFLVAPFGLQFQLLLQKTLDFKVLAIAEITSALFGAALAIPAALSGWGVFSLVVGQIGTAAIKTAILVAAGWPRWAPSCRFRLDDIRRFVRFGLYQLGDRLGNVIYSRTDLIIIGLILGQNTLGYYAFAWNLILQPVTRINPILTRVAFPLFAQIQSETLRLRRGYFSLLRLLTLINAPLLVGCAAVAAVATPTLFGDKWIPAISSIQILAFVGLIRAVLNPVGSLLLAKGRADVSFKFTIGVMFAQIPAVYLGAHFAGIMGAAATVAGMHILYLIAAYIFLLKPILGPSFKDYLSALIPPAGLAFVAAVPVILLPHVLDIAPSPLLLLQIFLGAGMYCGSIGLFLRNDLPELYRFVLLRG